MIIFRKNALGKLSSAEELDKSIFITNPATWITLWMIIILTVGFIIWSVLALVSSRVHSQGIFLPNNGRVVNVVTSQGETLDRIYVGVGDYVGKGDKVAKFSAATLEKRLKIAEKKLKLERKLYHKVVKQTKEERSERKINNNRHLKYIDSSISFLTKEIADSEQIFEENKAFYEDRSITQSALVSFRTNLHQLKNQLNSLILNRNELLSNESQIIHQEDIRLDKLEQVVNSLESDIELLKSSIEGTVVESPVAGLVIELKATQDEYVGPQTPLISIVNHSPPPGSIISKDGLGYGELMKQNQQEDIEFLAYVDVFNGKKIKPGMKVNVEVGYLDRNSYGFVKGSVQSISDFPLSSAGIYAKLANKNLVNLFLQKGPAYEVSVKLLKKTDSKNGFDWTSEKGLNVKNIDVGSIGTAEFLLEEKRPISLAIPWIKSLFN